MSDDPKTPRWTPQAVIGLLCLVAATVLRRLLDDDTGRDVADGLMLLGGILVGWAPALPPVKPPSGGSGPGNAATGLIVGAVLGLLSILAPGCASTERDGDTLQVRLRDDPQRAKPACLYRIGLDGELIVEGSLDECPAVPVCEEPK